MSNDTCRICGNTENLNYTTVNERMLGTLDEFIYFQCPQCNCLQIKQTPDNLENYYPDNYYSYSSLERLIKAPFRQWVDTHRVNHLVYGNSVTGMFLDYFFKPLEYIEWLKNTNVKHDSKILDVGCGQGRLLLRLALGGFTNLTGIDPFIKENSAYENGVKLIKTNLEEFVARNQLFDLIMLHHSLEHMPDQHVILQSIGKLLSPKGVALVRIPLADSYAWQHYKEHWVQLDAPRHLYLHSKKSLSLITKESGLKIVKTVYDSGKFQFTGSELYLRDIALNSSKKTRKIFSKKQLSGYEKEAVKLNISEKGDQAIFYLNKSAN